MADFTWLDEQEISSLAITWLVVMASFKRCPATMRHISASPSLAGESCCDSPGKRTCHHSAGSDGEVKRVPGYQDKMVRRDVVKCHEMCGEARCEARCEVRHEARHMAKQDVRQGIWRDEM